MAYRSSKQSSTDKTPNMPPPPPQFSQNNGEEHYYILKTNNSFLLLEPLCCNVFYVIQSLLLLSVSRTINIFIGHQLFNDDFINDRKCFITQYRIKMVKSINDRTVLSTVDVHWWMISNWSKLSIYQPGSRLVRQFIFNLQLLQRS